MKLWHQALCRLGVHHVPRDRRTLFFSNCERALMWSGPCTRCHKKTAGWAS